MSLVEVQSDVQSCRQQTQPGYVNEVKAGSRQGHVAEIRCLIGTIDCLQTRALTMCVCL